MKSYARFLPVAAIFVLGAGGASAAPVPCVGGFAGPYPCNKVDLLAFMTLPTVGGGQGNDVWGWVDPLTGREYAILGLTNATSFVDVTDPVNPVYVGRLLAPANTGPCVPAVAPALPAAPEHDDCQSPLPDDATTFTPEHCESGDSTWRDVEVYDDHAFIGSEQSNHGLVVFDLRQLRTVTNPPALFTQTARYCGYGNSHTTTVNTQTGFLYANGTASGLCSGGGPHIVDIRDPAVPVFAGCDSVGGYTHDSQCLVYQGPDVAHQGRSICINCNGPTDRLVIKDVTNPADPVLLSTTGYAGSGYPHQGWITADHRYYLLDDELDEQQFGGNTKTYIWDLLDLEAPQVIGVHVGPTTAIDHQQFIHGHFTYQSNYRAGLRILETRNIGSGQLSEVGFFDVYPNDNNPSFNGTWANYPFFPSGNVIVTTIESTGFGGFFVLRPLFADLALTATDSPDPVLRGQNVTYIFTVRNQGPTYASGATFSTKVAPDLTVLSVTSSQGTCTGMIAITCNLGRVDNEATATVTVVARVGAKALSVNSGRADVSAVETDTRQDDNAAMERTTIAR